MANGTLLFPQVEIISRRWLIIVAWHTAVSAGGINKPQVANYVSVICTLLYRRWINLAAGGWPQ